MLSKALNWWGGNAQSISEAVIFINLTNENKDYIFEPLSIAQISSLLSKSETISESDYTNKEMLLIELSVIYYAETAFDETWLRKDEKYSVPELLSMDFTLNPELDPSKRSAAIFNLARAIKKARGYERALIFELSWPTEFLSTFMMGWKGENELKINSWDIDVWTATFLQKETKITEFSGLMNEVIKKEYEGASS